MKIMDANRINEKREIYSFVGCMHREGEEKQTINIITSLFLKEEKKSFVFRKFELRG